MKDVGLKIEHSRSYARRAGIIAGDRLLAINGEPVRDFIDFQWFEAQAELELTIEDEQGLHQVPLKKPAGVPMGISLGEAIYPREKVCCNKCIFCFVDQLPCGLRKGMYLKDDDWRYSVMFGNFVTLTNVGEAEMQRIIRRKASPLNVSVHASDAPTRTLLLGNPKAGDIMDRLRRLTQAGIIINAQAVLVPGINTGDVLQQTMEELYSLGENVHTFAAVPVGLTEKREGLHNIEPFSRELAQETIRQVEAFAKKCRRESGRDFCYASDELYYIAQQPYPAYEDDAYLPQLGNGVGMYWDFIRDVKEACACLGEEVTKNARILSVTGRAAYGIIKEIAAEAMQASDKLYIEVRAAENMLFGSSVTVAGLLSGKDILLTAKEAQGAQGLLIPGDALRGDTFLDDMTLDELQQALGIPVRACKNTGDDYVQGILDLLEEIG